MAQNEHEMCSLPAATQDTSRAPKSPDAAEATLSQHSSITIHEPVTTTLHRNTWPVFVFALYATLALLAWILLCIMSRRPIRGANSYFNHEIWKPEHLFEVNQEYTKAAQVLSTIVALLTIPVTSALCSMAAVVYMQSGSLRKSLKIKQVMALADQGWIGPRTLWGLGIGKVGSLPLYFAFIFTLIGR
jgi:hypothetical protein